MKVVRWVGGAALAATLGMFSASAQAAPLGSAAEGLRETANQNALTQDVSMAGAAGGTAVTCIAAEGIAGSTATTTVTVIPTTAAMAMVRASTSTSAAAGTTIAITATATGKVA